MNSYEFEKMELAGWEWEERRALLEELSAKETEEVREMMEQDYKNSVIKTMLDTLPTG